MKIPISPRPEEVFIVKIKGIWWLTKWCNNYFLVHDCKKNTGLLGYDIRKSQMDCVICHRKPSYYILDQAIILSKLIK